MFRGSQAATYLEGQGPRALPLTTPSAAGRRGIAVAPETGGNGQLPLFKNRARVKVPDSKTYTCPPARITPSISL
eukprot:1158261-Pelagomonas_calceolata.AAC.12